MASVARAIESYSSSSATLDVAGSPVDAIAGMVEQRVGPQRYDMWFQGKTRWELDGAALAIHAANPFAANWIRSKFLDDVRLAAREVLGFDVRLTVAVDASVAPPATLALEPADPVLACITPAAPAHKHATPAAPLNPKYTLDEFVVGPSNQMAYHAATRVAEHPGQQFNPLFLHGMCGLGKTHLLQGICHRFAKLHPGKRALYLTGEQFTNEFLEALKTRKTDAFRRRIRSADLLVIDDVHFLANKKATQEEFLHTFNQIDATGKQVVLASDCAPKHITPMADSLVNRFVSGMVLRVDSPDLATRLEILRRRVAKSHYDVSDAVLMHIAQSATASVRELEGMLLQAAAGMSLGMGETTTPAVACLKQRSAAATAPVPVERIIRLTAEFFGLAPSTLLGNSREKTASLARSVASHLARQHTPMSYPEIARAMGNKNHSTIIAACQRIDAMLNTGALVSWTLHNEIRHQAMPDLIRELAALILRGR